MSPEPGVWLPLVSTVLAWGWWWAVPTVLGHLPPPVLADPGPLPDYRRLASPAFRAWVAALTWAALMLGLGLTPVPHWPAWITLGSIGVLLVAVDARCCVLPRVLWLGCAAGFLTSLGWVALIDPLTAGLAVAAAAAGGGLFWLLWRSGQGLGFGDVRLATSLAGTVALLDWRLTIWALLAGSIAGLTHSLARRWLNGRATPTPYGPGLLAGAYLALATTLLR